MALFFGQAEVVFSVSASLLNQKYVPGTLSSPPPDQGPDVINRDAHKDAAEAV